MFKLYAPEIGQTFETDSFRQCIAKLTNDKIKWVLLRSSLLYFGTCEVDTTAPNWERKLLSCIMLYKEVNYGIHRTNVND